MSIFRDANVHIEHISPIAMSMSHCVGACHASELLRIPGGSILRGTELELHDLGSGVS